MKKGIRWLGRLCVALLLLPLMVWAALYVPYVQRWVGGEVMRRLSVLTGYACSLERVSVRFPLDVHVDGLCLAHDSDTLLAIGQVEASVALRPLWRGEAVVQYLVWRDVVLHTDTLLHGVQVDGRMRAS